MFAEGSWLPEAKTEFMANVTDELVRFEEAALFAEGEVVTQPVELPKVQGVQFLTDGYGPSASMQQVGFALGDLLPAVSEEADAQAKDVNASDAPVA